MTIETPLRSLPLVPALAFGLVAGEALHRRVPERAFRRAVFAMLLGVAVVLAVKA